jgi:biofilm PGA synthesis N-glycosyltransferase PgaC
MLIVNLSFVIAAAVTVPLIAVLSILSALLIWQFVGFPLVMGIVALRHKATDKDLSFQPFVSIIVPTYNEEANIEERIQNLNRLDYPKQSYEIVVVDSGSKDNTVRIVQRLIEHRNGENRPELSIVQEERRNGKATAISVGKRHAQGDIILVTDANSAFNTDVLKEIAPYFKSPEVGAVGGRYSVSNPMSVITSATQFYWDIEQIERTGEAALDSACLFHGELNAWRRDIVEPDPSAISEDLDMCISIRKKGYKIEYEPKAVVYEAAPTSVEDQVKQRKRTSIGTIKSLVKNLRYITWPADLYRSLILPSHKGLAMLSPFILLAIPILYVLTFDAGVILLHFAATAVTFIVAFLLLMQVRVHLIQDDRTMRRFSIGAGFKIVWYVLLNELIVLTAWRDLILGQYSVLWEKVETTRGEAPFSEISERAS